MGIMTVYNVSAVMSGLFLNIITYYPDQMPFLERHFTWSDLSYVNVPFIALSLAIPHLENFLRSKMAGYLIQTENGLIQSQEFLNKLQNSKKIYGFQYGSIGKSKCSNLFNDDII